MRQGQSWAVSTMALHSWSSVAPLVKWKGGPGASVGLTHCMHGTYQVRVCLRAGFCLKSGSFGRVGLLFSTELTVD